MTEPPHQAIPLAERPPDAAPGGASRDIATGGPPLTAQPVIPLHRPGRWIATVIVLVVLAQCAHGLVTNPFFHGTASSTGSRGR